MKKIIFVLLASIWGQAAFAELVVVANPGVKINSLTQTEITRIFLGQAGTYPDGSVATPLDVSGDFRNSFYTYVLKKSPTQIEKYWARMIFTGKAQPPREVRIKEVKAVLADTRGGISYMDKSLVDESVKVITISN